MADPIRFNFNELRSAKNVKPSWAEQPNSVEIKEPKLLNESVISFKLHTLLAGLIAFVSFGTGAASIYYTARADLNDVKAKIAVIEAQHQQGRNSFEAVRFEISELKTDVKWIAKQVEYNSAKVSSYRERINEKGGGKSPSKVAPKSSRPEGAIRTDGTAGD